MSDVLILGIDPGKQGGIALEHYKDDVYRYRHKYKNKWRLRYKVKTLCAFCGSEYYRDRANHTKGGQPFCSVACRSNMKKTVMAGTIKYRRGPGIGGHQLIYVPDHPHAKKNFYSLHRHIIEQHLGRILDPKEIVHHIDCDKEHNEIDNFDLFETDKEHFLAHGSLNKCVAHLMKTGAIKYDRETHRYYTEEQ